jgi:hypothetical protein
MRINGLLRNKLFCSVILGFLALILLPFYLEYIIINFLYIFVFIGIICSVCGIWLVLKSVGSK